MGVGKLARGGLAGLILRWAGRLRFPYLFGLTMVVFLVNVFVPDALPFADEIVLGLFTVLLGSLATVFISAFILLLIHAVVSSTAPSWLSNFLSNTATFCHMSFQKLSPYMYVQKRSNL